MKSFLIKNKKLIIAAAIILVFTILLCIPPTLKVLVGVFGYAAYFYLLVSYAFFVLACKKVKIPVTKKRLALYVATVVLLIMTLHIGLCGKELVESGAGGYIGGSFDNFTVGGVLFTLLSLPVVLLTKFIAGVIIYFVATALCGFFLIAPLVFEPSEKVKKVNRTETAETQTAAPTTPTEVTKPIETKPVNITETPVVNTAVRQDTPPELDKNSREYAKKLLFGDHPVKKRAPKQTETVVPTATVETAAAPQTKVKNETRTELFNKQEESAGVYRIIDGVNAILVPPDVTPYTNTYLNQREEAKNKLFNYSIDDDYAQRSHRMEQQTMGSDVRETMGANPYIPSETLFETHENETAETTATVKPAETVVNSDETVRTTETGTTQVTDTTQQNTDDVLPTVQDSPFAAAVRADQVNGAPANVHTNTQTTTVTEKTKPVTVTPPVTRTETVVTTEETDETEKEEEDPSVIKQFRLKKPYAAPPVTLLQDHVKEGFSPYVDNYAELKEVFEVKLKNYGIDVTLINVIKGPTVTLCILDLDEKCSIKKVTSADKDIERLLKTPQGQSINILSKLPGTTYFGIEVPNTVKGVVSFKEIMASPEWNNAKGDLVLGLGKTNSGEVVIEDLAEMPHALVAGSSGSGKSVCINAIIASLLYRYSPDELKLVLIDLKYVEMANFAGLPHMLFKNPLNEVPEVINALNWLREETNRRFMAFRDLLCRNLGEYNKKVGPEKQLPRIVMIIDEASELMTHPTGRKVMEATLSSIARVARAAGVHMIFATQTPSKDVITSEIQNNMTTKIAFAVSDYVQSQVIFKSPEAAKLLGKGDMMIKKATSLTRAQCAFVSTPEIDEIVEYVKKNNPTEFDEDAIERILHGSKEEVPATAPVETREVKPVSTLLERKNFDDDAGFQDLVRESLKIFVNTGKVSATYVQRRFSKGYNTIANVMDYLEDKGYVSEPVNNKRTLLITKEQFYELYPDCAPEEDI